MSTGGSPDQTDLRGARRSSEGRYIMYIAWGAGGSPDQTDRTICVQGSAHSDCHYLLQVRVCGCGWKQLRNGIIDMGWVD